MTFTLSNIIDFSSVIAMLVMTAILLLVPKPKGPEWRSFRSSLKYLILAFVVLGAANVPTAFTDDVEEEILGATVIIVAYYQALLFSAVTIVMLHPRSRFIKIISLQVSIITLLSAVLMTTTVMWPGPLSTVAMGLAIAGYFALCAYYTNVFWIVYHRTQKRLEDYYDDDMNNRIVWMRRMFFCALFVGMLAIVASIWTDFYSVFTVIVIVFYVYLLSCMLRYMITANYLLKAVTDVTPDINCVTVVEQQETESKEQEEQGKEQVTGIDHDLEERLALWVERKEYTKQDVCVDEIASQLGVTHAALNSYFSRIKGTTFRNWRTQLRIEESKRLMQEYSYLSITEVAAQAGFNDRGNYHRAFMKSEHLTPTEYRRNLKEGK